MKSQLLLPEEFSDYELEVEAKGWFVAQVLFNGSQYSLRFYDPVRLSQDICSELKEEPLFYDANIVVVHSINVSSMKEAIAKLEGSGKFYSMKCDTQ